LRPESLKATESNPRSLLAACLIGAVDSCPPHHENPTLPGEFPMI
jgi:hypothetical protein